nr:hypothetical protein [Pandoravirus massiliensis]
MEPIDFLPDEIWDAILSGTGAHSDPILDPRWRPWAALVCRRWHRLVRGASARLAPPNGPALAKSYRHNHEAWTGGRLLCASSVADALVETESRVGADSPRCSEVIAEITRISLSARDASPVMVSLALEASGVPAALDYARTTLDDQCISDIEDAACDGGDGKGPALRRLSKWIRRRGKGEYLSSPLDHVIDGVGSPSDAGARVLDALRALAALRRRHPDALDRYDYEKVLSKVFDRYTYEAALDGNLHLLDRIFALGGSTRSGGPWPETKREPGVRYDDGDGADDEQDNREGNSDNGTDNDDGNDDDVNDDDNNGTTADYTVPYHLIDGARQESVRSRFARGNTVESHWVSQAVDGAIAGYHEDALDLIIERAGWICVMWAVRRAIATDCAGFFRVADARGLTYDVHTVLANAISHGGSRVCAHMAAVLQRTQGHIEPPLNSLISFPANYRVWSWAREIGFTPDASWFDDILRSYDVGAVGPWLAATDYAMEPRTLACLASSWPAETMEHAGGLALAGAAVSGRDECDGVGALLATLERAQCVVDLWAMGVDEVQQAANSPSVGRLFFALHWLARMAHYCDPAGTREPPHTHQIDRMLGIRHMGVRKKSPVHTGAPIPWVRFCRPQLLDDALVSCVHAALARPLDTLLDRVYVRRTHNVFAHLLDTLAQEPLR